MNRPRTEEAHHQRLQAIAKDLFTGVAPERERELRKMWDDYSPEFQILDDSAPDGNLIMDAGCYRYIRFNHRILRIFWLSSFAAWEGYCAFQAWSNNSPHDLGRFTQIIECIEATRVAPSSDDIPMPDGIPEPGELVDGKDNLTARISGELAIFAVGWAFLHEVRHLIHQHAGTSTTPDDPPEAQRQEELSCDGYATRFILDRIGEYSEAKSQPELLVNTKRQTGIHFALFALTLLARPDWGESETHPAIQNRINGVLAAMKDRGTSKGAAIISICAFEALKALFPNAPSPLADVSAQALEENWTPLDDLF